MKLGPGLARGALLFAGVGAGGAAFAGCATILGFEDTLGPLDGGEAGPPADDGEALGDTAEAGATAEAAAGYDAAPSGSCTQACVPPVPNGWKGPFVIAETAGGPGIPPPCGAGYSTTTFTGNADPVAPDAICGCTCSPPSGGSCGTAVVNFFSDSKCANPCAARSQKAPGCGTLDTSGCGLLTNPHYSLSAPILTAGSCTPVATKTPPPPVGWQESVQVCGPAPTEVPAGHCNGGQVCAASPPPSFTGHCVMSPGILTCPADYPAQKRQYFGGDSDSRDCHACTCGPVVGAACGIGTWSDSSCKSSATTVMAPQACLPAGLPYVANLSATPLGAHVRHWAVRRLARCSRRSPRPFVALRPEVTFRARRRTPTWNPRSTRAIVKSIYELREVGSVRSAVDVKNLETLYAPTDVGPKEQPAFSNGSLVAGKYQVESLIAEGGMGVVVLAKHVALQQRVAIKYLKANALGNQDAVDRFLREARLAARLTSEHVVRVQDVGSLPVGGPYMVMEYLVGESLGQVVERGPLPVAEAIDYILQACDALAEAHALKIVHRDIKPDNLFLARRSSNTPIIKVIDFGISKIGGSRHDGDDASREVIQKTATNERFGTPLYMSPEQLRSTADVDLRTDIWSIGVVLHELLTGLLPFPGTDIPQLCTSILTTAPRRLSAQRPGVSLALEGILLRCLEKDPAARYRNVGELAQELLPFGPASASARVARIQAVVRDGGHSIRPPTPLQLPLMNLPGGNGGTMMASEVGFEEPTDAAIHDMMRGSSRRKRRVGVAGMAALGVCTALGVYVAFAGPTTSTAGSASGAQPESTAVTAAPPPSAMPQLGSALLPAAHPVASASNAAAGAPKRAKALPLRPVGTPNGAAPVTTGDAAKRRAMFGERE